MTDLEIFCRQVRARSKDHAKAIDVLYRENIPSQIISILRQELDSMIRVIYLLSIKDITYRNELITASVHGKEWKEKNTKKRITDRKMADLANELQGWTKSVYSFGCAFIHLSNFHDYKQRDPLSMISNEEREAIISHMKAYHFGPQNPKPKFSDLIPYLPSVFSKIKSNLEVYIIDLQNGETIEE
ncbi:MAG: hypothetical protein JNK81_14655 [Anaerolineales bacterium]|nr:hypothetical protein [Anaerolineales bacterium]